MGIKMEFARGDSYRRGFILKSGETGEPVVQTWDDIYFTVKKQHADKNFKFQKRLSEGGITDDGDGHYTLYIEPEDTDWLAFGSYDIDIEVKGQGYKRTFFGSLNLTPEVTHVNNE